MLASLGIRDFKSLRHVQRLEMASLTVFFGPNAAGKSNLLDALTVLSRLSSARTLADAVRDPVRGLPLELFSLPSEGLPGLLRQAKATFRLEADLVSYGQRRFRYACEVSIAPKSGTLSVKDEYLVRLTDKGAPLGNPVIGQHDGKFHVRRKTKPAHPWQEPVGLNHTILSNERYSGKEYEAFDLVRQELRSYRSYYFDPRVAMRAAQPPRDVDDIGTLGEHLGPYLYRMQGDKPEAYDAVRRTLRTIVPSVEDLAVRLDEKQGIVNIEIRQDGTFYSGRVVSEGTLRVLGALCVALNPWGGALVAFEEPENGVHPRRIELMAEIFATMALRGSERRQVVLTTHSPLFCGAILRLAKKHPKEVRMFRVIREAAGTSFSPFDPSGPLFQDVEIQEALTAPSEDAIFEGLMLRGLLDG